MPARLVLLLPCLWWSLCACRPAPAQEAYRYDSGGPLSAEQAAYDVAFYDLALRIDPADSTLQGTLTATVRITAPTPVLVFDLDPALAVTAVAAEDGTSLPFTRRGGKLRITFPLTRQPGETVTVAVTYGGRPRTAPQPPWDGGLVWARTPSGAPWIATAVQTVGADVWWPVKDHVSDEPDSMALHLTVPAPLVAAANGRLRSVTPHPDGTRTYHWFVSTPINTYNVALNIAPYHTLDTTYVSVTGEPILVQFFVLPEHEEAGRAFLPEILDHLRFFEQTLGPYPFRADKYGVAQTPYLGMEHQTIIAYGAGFDNGAMTGGVDWGFDALHHHELAHEWWGNQVTGAGWEEMWLHEGFGTYMQPLYLERTRGPEVYRAYLDSLRPRIANRRPVAPRAPQTARQIYDGDLYFKGAWILHTLRYLLGDEPFFAFLRQMATPPGGPFADARCACRFAVTDDALHLAEALSGRSLDWFFEVYLRRAPLPELEVRQASDRLTLRWHTPDDLPFPMPVDVQIDDTLHRVALPDGTAVVPLPPGARATVDPHHWILRAMSP